MEYSGVLVEINRMILPFGNIVHKVVDETLQPINRTINIDLLGNLTKPAADQYRNTQSTPTPTTLERTSPSNHRNWICNLTTIPLQLQYGRGIWHIILGGMQTLPGPTRHRTFICTVDQRHQRRPVVSNDIVRPT